jgi:hypothetical protein
MPGRRPRGAESPRARTDEDLGAPTADLLDGERDASRPEQAAALGRAALAGTEGLSHTTVQWIRRRDLDVTDDRQGQQQRASHTGADA